MRLNRHERTGRQHDGKREVLPFYSTELPALTFSFRLKRYWTNVLDWVYPGGPAVCVLCNRAIPPLSQQQRVHISAWADVPESLGNLVCPFCLQEARDIRPNPVRRRMNVVLSGEGAHGDRRVVQVPVYSVFRYEGFVQRAIRPWKYDGALEMTEWFANGLLSTAAVTRLADKIDGIVPVPTAPERLRQRGYHHTLLLAKSVAATCRLPVLQVLERGWREEDLGDSIDLGRQTQTAKSASERRSALVGAFSTRKGVDITGARLLLLDDVVTTGATMEACVTQLMAAGAAEVVCMAIADVQ